MLSPASCRRKSIVLLELLRMVEYKSYEENHLTVTRREREVHNPMSDNCMIVGELELTLQVGVSRVASYPCCAERSIHV